MTQLESAVWRLFKEYFNQEFIKKATHTTLIGIRDYLKKMLSSVEKEIEKYEE